MRRPRFRAPSVSAHTALRAGRRLTGIELVAVAFAIGIAHAFYVRTVWFPSDFDAKGYLDIAADIARHGLFSKFHNSEARPYGYPLFLRFFEPVAATLGLSWRFVVFEAQLGLFVAAVLLVRARLLRVSRRVATITTVALLANPFALVYVAETLTEALSLVLFLVAAACWVGLSTEGTRKLLALAIGSAAVGIAVVVRSANVFAVPAWFIAVCAIVLLQRWPGRRILAAAATTVVAACAPLVPQIANNVRHYGVFTPLVAFDLYRQQQIWGIENLKYATALPPVPDVAIHYVNPFLAGRPIDVTRPQAWYVEHPIHGLALLGLHVFGMLDQDLLFPYARDLDPWYRRPLGVATHGVVFLALAGLVVLGHRARRAKSAMAVCAALGAVIACHIAVHATTAVEMRFGLPLLVLDGPLAAWFVVECLSTTPAVRRAVMAIAAIAWIAGALTLSDWMRDQSPQIRAVDAARPRTG